MNWLIGAGAMAQAYCHVLNHLQLPVTVVGRSHASASAFTQACGVEVQAGGLESFLATQPELPERAIVAVDVIALPDVCQTLIDYGVRQILLEKPGGLYASQLRALETRAKKARAQVYIAYNRRFFASVQTAKTIIEQDGGALSFDIEMTEWAHKIAPLDLPDDVKQRWLIANTAHVIDAAFYLGGEPVSMQCFQAGSLAWHRSAAIMTGAGNTTSGALFSYQGNWQSAGRWGVVVSTAERSLQLSPMEQLRQQRRGEITWEPVAIDDDADMHFKPGLLQQVRAFVAGECRALCTLSEQIFRLAWYEKMGNYSHDTRVHS
ncbi:Gfo/Idh/MocA family oxidoreductase [Alteromonas sp. CYL-A6]|uniref:Gfo/Idh/MocA family oxidoreductase n=1 Tax=Alteromonas nitratireducens TaxID=3390813 RepID=UPI0034BBF029